MRYVLVDRITSLTPGRTLRAIKNVSAGDAMLTRYGPGTWMLPASMVLEAMAQAAGLLVIATLEEGALPVLAKVRPFSVYADALPGDQICLDVGLEELGHGGCRALVTASIEQRPLATATLYLALAPLDVSDFSGKRATALRSALADAFPGWFGSFDSVERPR
jgi:3-hydroxyacyl-[acyl-carrier-protein] dehydratase